MALAAAPSSSSSSSSSSTSGGNISSSNNAGGSSSSRGVQGHDIGKVGVTDKLQALGQGLGPGRSSAAMHQDKDRGLDKDRGIFVGVSTTSNVAIRKTIEGGDAQTGGSMGNEDRAEEVTGLGQGLAPGGTEVVSDVSPQSATLHNPSTTYPHNPPINHNYYHYHRVFP